MPAVLRSYLSTGMAISAAMIAAPPAQLPAAGIGTTAIRVTLLTGEGYLAGADTALVMGATGFATPSQGWLNAFDKLYLGPHGFGGATQSLTTPEGLYPFNGPLTMTYDNSTSQGLQILERAIAEQLKADPTTPVVVTGYSQSSTIDTLLMQDLARNGGVISAIKDANGNALPDIHAGDLHFMLVADPNNPNGGLLDRFAIPGPDTPQTAPALGLTFNGATPSDVSPTDVYTYEYDGFADFPKYPINFLADINAYLGIVFNHIGYLGLAPDQIANAHVLPVSDPNSLTNYFMIDSPSLPLLDILRLVPVIGNPLADLIQPDLQVLVNIGYGDIAQGWSPGAADVQSLMGFLPPLDKLLEVPGGLINGLFKGVWDSLNDWFRLSNYLPISPETWTDVLGPLVGSATAAFNLDQGWTAIQTAVGDFLKGAVNWFTEGLQEISLPHTGIPLIDMAQTVLFTLPTVAFEVFDSHLKAGDLLGAIGDPLAALVGLSPLLVIGSAI